MRVRITWSAEFFYASSFLFMNYKPNDKEFGSRALARKFNMNHSNISRLVNNLKYKYFIDSE